MKATTLSPQRPASDTMTLAELTERLNSYFAGIGYQLAPTPPAAPLEHKAQLRELRAALPARRLTIREGMVVAERQAALLRWQIGADTHASLNTAQLRSVTFVRTIIYRHGMAKSGLTTKTASGWVVVLREDEPIVRQRFSLCHEIKHILDDRAVEQSGGGLYHSAGLTPDEAAERICDHFAACLLMPKIQLKRDWGSGQQDTGGLARRYNVSKAAMEVRLRTVGLLEPTPRCAYQPDLT
jgi:Zn-dependent peptidase ImmA (M78 family)